jgi:3-oxoacyl-[acyl-carrier protein] reductase
MDDVAELLDLRGQVALVTGASRGIGRAIAALFHRAGARIALLSRDAAALAVVAQELAAHPDPAATLVVPCDVADAAQVSAAVGQIAATWGRLDILVNNAGLIHAGSLETITPDAWQRVLGANLTGAYLCCRAVAPLMRQQRAGRIINIASITAQTGGVSGGVDYAASKGGLLALTKTLARDLAPDNITVNAIAPGQIATDPALLSAEARRTLTPQIPLGRLGEPREIAYAALFLASPMAAYITGATIDVNGGLLKR